MFTDLSTDSAGSKIINWEWYFGNGQKIIGTPSPQILYNTAGNYNVKLIIQSNADNTCKDSITKTINIQSKFSIKASNDIVLCTKDTALLNVVQFNCGTAPYSYLWNNASSLSAVNTSSPKAFPAVNTTYIVKVTDNIGQIAFDTVTVTVNPNCCKSKAQFLTNKTLLCFEDTLQITNVSKAKLNAIYNWIIKPNASMINYTGKTPPKITFNQKGIYNIKLTLTDSCGTDTISQNIFVLPKAIVNAGRDTAICQNDTIQIGDLPIGRNVYQWTPTINLSNAKIANPKAYFKNSIQYVVNMIDEMGCIAKDSIYISKNIESKLSIGNDTSICTGDTIVLKAFLPNANFYKWNDNSSLPTLKVFNAGKYSVQTGNKCGNYDTSINVLTKNCDCNIYMPNVFSPNHSAGANDVFLPVLNTDCTPTFYKLQIYDRWGAELFNSNEINNGWNGKYKDKLVPNGVYVWILTLQHPYMNNNKIFKKTGSVLILE